MSAYAKINANGQWVDRSECVNLNELFERMSREVGLGLSLFSEVASRKTTDSQGKFESPVPEGMVGKLSTRPMASGGRGNSRWDSICG